MNQRKHWVFRRPKDIERLYNINSQKLEFYRKLKCILEPSLDGKKKEETSAPPPEATEKTHFPSESTLLEKHEIDSALGASLNVKTDFETPNDGEFSTMSETLVSSLTSPPTSGIVEEESEQIPQIENPVQSISGSNSSTQAEDDWQLAEEFHAALDAEVDAIRRQLAEILKEGPILFPLELISQFYIRFGRKLPQLYDGFSTRSLLAWLRCISCLNLDNLVVITK